jgi:hypothetical protein
MLHLFANIFHNLYLAALSAGPVPPASGGVPATGGFSQVQGLTLSGWVMLIPGIAVGVVVLYLALTAPLWRKRHLHHW